MQNAARKPSETERQETRTFFPVTSSSISPPHFPLPTFHLPRVESRRSLFSFLSFSTWSPILFRLFRIRRIIPSLSQTFRSGFLSQTGRSLQGGDGRSASRCNSDSVQQLWESTASSLSRPLVAPNSFQTVQDLQSRPSERTFAVRSPTLHL